jgi:hypothetical protein
MSWLRSYPKTEAGKELRTILLKLSGIKSVSERDAFIEAYGTWLNRYRDFILSLPRNVIAFKDLNRTIGPD